jgi:uncharacterized membrane-anchored protein YitT (DUF2179 family)
MSIHYKIKNKLLIDYVYILLGSISLALSTNIFYEVNEIAPGGITGLSIIIETIGNKFFSIDIPIWFSTIMLNVPLMIWGLISNGKKFIFRSVVAIIMLSIMLYITKFIKIAPFDMIISVMYGAILAGVGIGLVLKSNASTGGTDLIASILTMKKKRLSIGTIMFCFDAFVITCGFFVFGPERALYAIIAEFITSRIVSLFLGGFVFCKCVFMISERTNDLAEAILNKLQRGVTNIKAQGMYTMQEKNILFCVITDKEIVALKEIIEDIDPAAFVIVSDANEVLGQGFKIF